MKKWIVNSLREAAWAPLLVFCFYAVAAKGFQAYLLFPWLDMPTHFAGGMAMTWFFRVSVTHLQEVVGRIPNAIRLALSLGLTAIVAVVWEFLEFFSDVALGTQMNLGVADTLSDLFFGLAGGLLIVVVSGSKTERELVPPAKPVTEG